MSSESVDKTQFFVEQTFHKESRRIYASLVRMLRDFDLAEEAMHEAFATAIERWPIDGIPTNPRTWLISTGKFKAIDAFRRKAKLNDRHIEVTQRLEEIARQNESRAEKDIEDDQLRLIFTCCHPAIDPLIQVPLTLREVCGLTTEEIANAFLVAPTTLAQRIVRGKSKIRDAGIPIDMPTRDDFPQRLDAVLSVIYLVFNEGYSATSGDSHTRSEISSEAIRLGRLLVDLLPDPEALGLLALMLFQESRRLARVDSLGDIIVLEDQDRSKWNQEYIREGRQLMNRILATRMFGMYSVQAAIAAEHAIASSPDQTNWAQISALYDVLFNLSPSPVIELNRAVAISMRDRPESGIRIINEIHRRGDLNEYHLSYAALADLYRRAQSYDLAKAAYVRALDLTQQEPERRFLQRRIREMSQYFK